MGEVVYLGVEQLLQLRELDLDLVYFLLLLDQLLLVLRLQLLHRRLNLQISVQQVAILLLHLSGFLLLFLNSLLHEFDLLLEASCKLSLLIAIIKLLLRIIKLLPQIDNQLILKLHIFVQVLILAFHLLALFY